MTISSKLKTLAATTGVLFCASAASAATVATLELRNGEYFFDDNALFSPLVVSADVSGELFPFDPTAVADYAFGASLTVDGDNILDGSFVIEDTSFEDLLFGALLLLATLDPPEAAIVEAIGAEVFDGDLEQTEILPDLFFGFEFELLGADDSTFDANFTAILSPFPVTDVPADATGTFEADLSISTVAPIPLPASLPLLALAGAGLFGLRRART